MVQFRASHMPMNFGDIEKALGFSVGYDSMFDRLFGESFQPTTSSNTHQGYPPYNIRKEDDYNSPRRLGAPLRQPVDLAQ